MLVIIAKKKEKVLELLLFFHIFATSNQ